MTGDSPVYVQVADQLEELIASLAAGEPMPSEHELARDHEINRLTARAALEELERRYLVRRQQGRRTVVARRIRYPLSPTGVPGWTKIVRSAGGEPRTELDTLRQCVPPKEIRAALQLSKKAPAFQLGRRRFVDDELAAYSESWLRAALVPKLESRVGKTGSLHAALKKYDLHPKRGLLRCELAVASPDVAERLAAPDRPLVFVLTTQLRSGKRDLAVTTTWLRADVFNVVYQTGEPSL
ncbi:MAG: GntR family transcriptional regulator [Candidatus Velthaea sp.]